MAHATPRAARPTTGHLSLRVEPREGAHTALVAHVSDLHEAHTCPYRCAAVEEWLTEWRPELLVLNGDIFDLAPLSAFEMAADEEPRVMHEIRAGVERINRWARKCDRTVLLLGNHEKRWAKIFTGKAVQLFGAHGLTVADQLRAQGLDPSIVIIDEGSDRGTLDRPPLLINDDVAFAHGDRQASRFGGMYPAAQMVRETRQYNSMRGHTHTAQTYAITSHGRTFWGVSNGALEAPQPWNGRQQWTHSVSAVEVFRDHSGALVSTPHLLLFVGDGLSSFAYGGRRYCGREIVRRWTEERAA